MCVYVYIAVVRKSHCLHIKRKKLCNASFCQSNGTLINAGLQPKM